MSATVGELIRRYLDEVSVTPSKASALRVMLRMPFAAKQAAKLKSSDYLDYCKLRRAKVAAATVALDLTHWRSVIITARVMWDMQDVSLAPLVDAKPILAQRKLIGAPRKRNRRPSEDELARLLAHFRASKSAIPMADIVEFALTSGRRISETCRITWGDYARETQTIMVRNVKHAVHKDGNDKRAALLTRANEIIQAQPRRTSNPDERIFPYNSRSATQRFIAAKKKLGIIGLVLHDQRGECATRMLEAGYSVPEIQLVTLHDDPATLLRRYANRLKPEDLRLGPAAKRQVDARPAL